MTERKLSVEQYAKQRIAELEAENERLAKDAARYRWLRDVEEPVASEVARRFLWLTNDAFDEFVDAAIDAALAGKP